MSSASFHHQLFDGARGDGMDHHQLTNADRGNKQMRLFSMKNTAYLATALFTHLVLSAGAISCLAQDEEPAAAADEATSAAVADGEEKSAESSDKAAAQFNPYIGVLSDVLAGTESDRLELSDETLAKLKEFAEQRTANGIQISAALKDADPVERETKLQQYRFDSLRLAKEALLNVKQRDIVEQLRLRRRGLVALAEPQIAGTVVLDEDQKKKVGELAKSHLQLSAAAPSLNRAAQLAELEKQLNAVLSEDQQTTWNQLTGATKLAQADGDDKPEPGDTDRPDTKPMKTETEGPSSIVTSEGDVKLRFSFRFTPWEEVITWFAEQADLSLDMPGAPPGTFNYTDRNYYTPAQAIDVMNGVLLTRGFTLVRRRNLLTLVDLEDDIPDVLVEYVPLSDIDDRGEYELVKTLFQLVKMTPEEAQTDLQSLIGPTGKIYIFPAAKQILIQEMAGRLRTIRSVIEAIEKPRMAGESTITELKLEWIPAEDVLVVARILLGISGENNQAEGISFGIDPLGTSIFLTGADEKIAIVRDLVTRMDIDPLDGVEPGVPTDQPQLQTHTIQVADPTSAYEVLQTMLSGLPDIRMALDPATNKIIAYARPSEQLTIRAVIAELEGDVPIFEVISLRTLDPSMALAMIGNMFGGDPEAPDPNGPKVTADITTMKLFVRATKSEMDAIKQMIARLEEENTTASGGNIRLIPWSGQSAIDAVERASRLWSGGNSIRLIAPKDRNSSRLDLRRTNEPPAQPDPQTLPPNPVPPQPNTSTDQPRPLTNQQRLSANSAVQYVAEQAKQAQQPVVNTGKEIIVEVTDEGILLISEDIEALDRFETLLRQFMPINAAVGDRKITVFYLKFAKADVAASLIQQILSGGTESSDIGSLVGDITGGLMGGGGGLMGMLLGGGGASEESTGTTFEATGTVSIVADPRLNALVVQAVEEDVVMIEELLDVIDKEGSITDVQTQGKPRLIPVIYTSAESVADTIKQVYADRVVGASSGGAGQRGGGQPSPEQFMQMLRGASGGRGGQGGRTSEAKSEPTKMAIGVDAESNSIVIAAPEPLFREVEDLVRQLDIANIRTQDAMEVRTLKLTNPDVVKQALESILGDQLQTSTSSSSGSRTSSGGSNSGQPSMEQIRQRIDAFNRLRSGGGGFPGSSGGSGRPGGGSSFGRPGGSGGTPGGGRPGGGTPGGGRPGGGRP